MSQLGCDVDQMAALEELFARHGAALVTSASRIDGALVSLTWWGSDSTAFTTRWKSSGRTSVLSAARLLQSSSNDVKRNRLEQVAASDGSNAGSNDGSVTKTDVSASWTSETHATDVAVGNGVTHNRDGSTTTTRTSTVTLADGTKQDRTTTVVTDANGKVVSYETKSGPPEKPKPEVKVETELASGSVDARQDLLRSTGSTEGQYGSGSYDVSIGAKEHAGYSVTAGSDGVQVKADASASVGAEASAEGELHYGVISAGGEAKVAAGANAEVHTDAGISPDGVHAGAGGSAELAATADANASVDVAGVTGTVEGGVGVGLGAHADVDASLSFDKIGAKVDVGAYIGLGGNVSFDVSVDPKELAGNAVEFGSSAGDGAVHVVGDAASAIGGFLGW